MFKEPREDRGAHSRMQRMPQVPHPDLFLRSAMVQSRSRTQNMHRLPVRPMERKEEGTVAMHQMQRHVHHGPFPVVDDSEEHQKCEKLQVQQLLVEGEGVGESRGSIELGACGEEYEAASQEVEQAASGRPPQAASSDGRLPSTPHLQFHCPHCWQVALSGRRGAGTAVRS